MESLEFTLAYCKVFVSEKSTLEMLGATFYQEIGFRWLFFLSAGVWKRLWEVTQRSCVPAGSKCHIMQEAAGRCVMEDERFRSSTLRK